MKYSIVRTDKADEQIISIVLSIAKSFGREVALKKLEQLEERINALADMPEAGLIPADAFLRRRGYSF